MKKAITPLFLLICFISLCHTAAAEDDEWRENVDKLIYSPRYFGPSAFPMPELRDSAGRRYEIELRGEYHHYSGDKTYDLFGRILLPFIKDRAGMEVTWVLRENYKLTPETRDERHAVDVKSPIKYEGDIVVSSYFEFLKSEKWFDAMASVNLKTASGGRLCDARFTDAAAYWIDATVAKNVWKSKDGRSLIRLKGLAGFYCWETNNMVHRQNDAVCFAAGATAIHRHFTFSTHIVGFHGYEDNGDKPLVWKNMLRYEWRKNVLSLRFNHGMKDNLYDTFSVGLIRQF